MHKTELVKEAHNLIIKEYKLKLLDPASDEPSETQGGLGSQEKDKDDEEVQSKVA